MAPKKSQKAKAEQETEDKGVEPAPSKDKSKVPGGKAGGAASGQLLQHCVKSLRAFPKALSLFKLHTILCSDSQRKRLSGLLVVRKLDAAAAS